VGQCHAIHLLVIENTRSNSPSGISTSRLEARTEAILRAALEELADVGYSALSFEAVASRVGIAKTTVYRRYSTKAALVRAAIQKFIDGATADLPNSGSLRGDLIALGLQKVQVASSVCGQSLFRLGFLDRSEPELAEMSKDFDAHVASRYRALAERAVDRGELLSVAALDQLMEVLSGALLFKLVIKRQSVDELEIARIVDMLLNGITKPLSRPRGALRG